MGKFLFTSKGIESLKATGLQTDHWDTLIGNFGLRVSSKGKKAWVLLYRYEGRQRRYTLGHYPDLPLADARQAAQAAKGELAKGNDPAAAKEIARRASTFGNLARDYLVNHAKPKKKSWQEDERIINKEFLPAWKHKRLIDFRSREIRAVIDQIAHRDAGIMANRCLSLVKTIFAFGVDNGWLDSHPCSRLRRPALENCRDRVLSTDEIRSVWQALEQEPDYLRSILRLQLLTAQRINEVATMRCDDLDLEDGWWAIPPERSKNHRLHRVPLSPQAIAILKDREPLAQSGYMFAAPRDHRKPIQMATIHKGVERVRKTSRVEFRTHDLRRTAATLMAAAGVPSTVLGKILNHREHGVTARHYNWHDYNPEKKTALEAWGRTVDDIVSKAPKSRKVIPIAS